MLSRFNALIYLLANVSVALVPFILMPILTRHLGPEGYGQVSMFLVAISFTGACVGLSTHGAIGAKWYQLSNGEIGDFVSSCVCINIILFLFVALLINVFSDLLESFLLISIEWVYIAALVSLLNAFILIRLAIWQVNSNARKYALIQVMIAFVLGYLSYYFVVKLGFGAEGRVYGHLLAYLVFFLICTISLISERYIRLSISKRYITGALKFGVPLIPHVVGAYMLSMVDRMLINKYLGSSAAGSYMVYVQISLCLYIISDAFNKALLPVIYRVLSEGEYKKKVNIVRISYAYSIFLALCVFLSYLIGTPVISIIAGDEFILPEGVLPILVLAQAFQGMYFLVTNYIFYKEKTYYTAIATFFSGILGCTFIWFYIDDLGVYGAAIGQAIGMFSLWMLTWFFANRVCPMPWFDLKVFKRFNYE